jgi:hypothetical protein
MLQDEDVLDKLVVKMPFNGRGDEKGGSQTKTSMATQKKTMDHDIQTAGIAKRTQTFQTIDVAS